MTPEELQAQRVEEAAKKQVEEQEVLNQQKRQMQEALGEVLAPIQQALVDLQGKYQAIQESQIQAENKPTKTRDQEMDEMLGEINSDDKYEKLSNRQLVSIISSSLDSALTSSAKSVREGVIADMQPQVDKVSTLEKTTLQILAGIGVQRARDKHEDFDKHTDEIKEVLNKYPGMEFEDAYLLAKSQKAGATPPRGHIDSEKPTSNSAVPDLRPNPTAMTADNMEIIAQRGRDARSGETLKHGHAGFMELAEAAADKILLARDA